MRIGTILNGPKGLKLQDQTIICADVFVGVDVGKLSHWAYAVNQEGDKLFSRAVLNDESAIDAMIGEAQGYGAVTMVVDTTSPVAHLLLGAAARQQLQVAYLRGTAMRQAAGLYAGEAKTDPKDAFVLADHARRNSDRLSWIKASDPHLARLRLLNSRDVDLAADANRAVLRLRQALVAVCPALERAVGKRLASSAGARDLLVHWPTPTELKAAGRARIRSLIARRSPRVADKLASAIWDALKSQTLVAMEEETWGEVIADLAGELEGIDQRRRKLAEEIKSTFRAHHLGQVLESLCGFGPRTGARALAEIGDPHRFENGACLASYSGLAPVDRHSGCTRTTRRSKAGNHRLKDAMYMAAFVAVRHDPVARAHYDKKRAEGKNHRSAVICVARRRCDLILAMLKTQTLYRKPEPQVLPQAA